MFFIFRHLCTCLWWTTCRSLWPCTAWCCSTKPWGENSTPCRLSQSSYVSKPLSSFHSCKYRKRGVLFFFILERSRIYSYSTLDIFFCFLLNKKKFKNLLCKWFFITFQFLFRKIHVYELFCDKCILNQYSLAIRFFHISTGKFKFLEKNHISFFQSRCGHHVPYESTVHA